MVLEALNDFYLFIVSTISTFLGPAREFPNSSITILIIALLMALFSSLITRLLTDVEKVRRIMTQVREWQTAYMNAVKSKDSKQIEKLKKKEVIIKRLQAEMMREQLKPLIFTLVPFLIIYYLFTGVFEYNHMVVAISPLTLPFIGKEFTFITWYIITSISFSALIQRIFNLPSAQD
ncbi:MAG: EMC3/TMCO1 family protein [Candidatus Methanomethyliaceae archaeon]